jgi:hypothetical protein
MLKTVSTANGLISPTFSGDVTLSNGNLIIGTSGKGIDFSATPGTGTSELLSDYEEGTFTPEFTTSGGDFTSVTYGQQVGRYTRIGRMVYIYIRLFTTAYTGGSGSLQVKGLPFTANANTDDATIPVTFAFGWSSNPAVVGGIVGNNTKFTLYYSLVNQECPFNSMNASGGSYLRMAGCYEAA